jgi:hypothetical protein
MHISTLTLTQKSMRRPFLSSSQGKMPLKAEKRVAVTIASTIPSYLIL